MSTVRDESSIPHLGRLGSWLAAPAPRAYHIATLPLAVAVAVMFARSASTTAANEVRLNETLGIPNLISTVQRELAESEIERVKRGEAPIFRVTDFDMEIHFIVRSSSTVDGRMNVQILTAGGEASFGSEKVHKLHLHMVVPDVSQVHRQAASSRAPDPSASSAVKPETKESK